MSVAECAPRGVGAFGLPSCACGSLSGTPRSSRKLVLLLPPPPAAPSAGAPPPSCFFSSSSPALAREVASTTAFCCACAFLTRRKCAPSPATGGSADTGCVHVLFAWS